MTLTPTVGSMYGSGPTRSFLGIPVCEALTPLEADAVVLGIPAATPYPSVRRTDLLACCRLAARRSQAVANCQFRFGRVYAVPRH
jgi:hypothetical protein